MCVCVCVCPFQPLNKLPDFHKNRYEHNANEGHHNAGIIILLKLVKAERRKHKLVRWGATVPPLFLREKLNNNIAAVKSFL